MTDTTVIEHKAGPAPDEPPYGRACIACAQSWPCPAKREALQAEAAEIIGVRMHESRRIGALSLVEIGVTVSSYTRRKANGNYLGGVIIDITDVPNPETGEFERTFTCLDRYDRPVRAIRIAEAEVLPSCVEGTPGSSLTALVVRLAEEVAALRGSYLPPDCADRIRWMHTLAGVINLAA